MHVTWTALTSAIETGDSTILSYNLQWDAGSNKVDWHNLIGFSTNSLSTSFTVSSGIAPGSCYFFRVRAKNIYGYGDFSDAQEIKASGTPSQMTSPTVTNEGTDVKISWVAPNMNSGTL